MAHPSPHHRANPPDQPDAGDHDNRAGDHYDGTDDDGTDDDGPRSYHHDSAAHHYHSTDNDRAGDHDNYDSNDNNYDDAASYVYGE